MSDSIFDNNFSKLKAYNSSLANALYTFSLATEYEISIDQGKEIGLIVDGRQLCSHHDRMGYADARIRRLNLNSPVTVYGFALGDEIRAILSKNNDAEIEVVLLNPALFYTLLSLDDEIYQFFRPNIRFTIADDGMNIKSNSVISFQELYIDPKTFNSLKMKLINYLDNDFAVKEYRRINQGLKEAALRANYELLKQETLLDMSDLEDISDNVLITAAGPSLENSISTLKELKKQGHTLIAVDSSLACLEDHNIVPDYIVSCDMRVYRALKHLIFKESDNYKNSTLIFSATSEAELFTKFKGKRRFIFRSEDLKIADYLDRTRADFLEFYGSVLNEAVALALKTKPKAIKLFGADFAYRGTKTHASIKAGTAINISEVKMKVLCNDGQIQHTERNFSLYREELEKEIASHPEVRFENYSKTGAVIHGAHIAV